MLISELADELQIDAGNMSRQVRLYYRLQNRDRPPRLDQQAIDDFRAAHKLVTGRAEKNYPHALRRVLGLNDPPVSPAAVLEIKQLLDNIRDGQLRTDRRLNSMAKHFKLVLERMDKHGGADSGIAGDEQCDHV